MVISIHQAATLAEKEQVYRFRYKIYHEELQKNTVVVDHDKKMIADECDDTAVILYAKENDVIVGTLRANLGCIAQLPQSLREKFQTKMTEEVFGSGKVSVTEFLMVKPEYRGGPAAAMLMTEIFNLGLTRGIELNYCLCELPLLRIYQRLGYKQYRPHIYLGEDNLRVPLILCLRDYDYLLQVHSPFALSLSLDQSDHGRASKLLSHIYDEYDLDPIFIDEKIIQESKSTLFKNLKNEQIKQVIHKMTLVKFSVGDYICMQESKNIGLVLVLTGHFWQQNSKKFVAVEPSVVLTCSQKTFGKIALEMPAIAAIIQNNLLATKEKNNNLGETYATSRTIS